MANLLDGAYASATADRYAGPRLPGQRIVKPLACGYPGGVPETVGHGLAGRHSVCLSLACAENFQRPLLHSYAAATGLLVKGF